MKAVVSSAPFALLLFLFCFFGSLCDTFHLSCCFCAPLVFPSEHQNHARELVKKADLSQWDALVIMSGDGLLFEVLALRSLWFQSNVIINM